LLAEPDVELVFVQSGERLPGDAQLVILPGSKSTISDLADLRLQGWDSDLAAHIRRGGRVIGICGGYQMLGRAVRDPLGIEGQRPGADGLGLLDVETVMAPRRRCATAAPTSAEHGDALSGYQIHLGVTEGADCDRPFAMVDGLPDGATSGDGRVTGTYLHGLFASDVYRSRLLRSFGLTGEGRNYRAGVEQALDEVAADLERHLDRRWLGEPARLDLARDFAAAAIEFFAVAAQRMGFAELADDRALDQIVDDGERFAFGLVEDRGRLLGVHLRLQEVVAIKHEGVKPLLSSPVSVRLA
jgi:cobyric acid synthase